MNISYRTHMLNAKRIRRLVKQSSWKRNKIMALLPIEFYAADRMLRTGLLVGDEKISFDCLTILCEIFKVKPEFLLQEHQDWEEPA